MRCPPHAKHIQKEKAPRHPGRTPGLGDGDENTSFEQPRHLGVRVGGTWTTPPASTTCASQRASHTAAQRSGHGLVPQGARSSLFLPHCLILWFVFCLFFLFTLSWGSNKTDRMIKCYTQPSTGSQLHTLPHCPTQTPKCSYLPPLQLLLILNSNRCKHSLLSMQVSAFQSHSHDLVYSHNSNSED